MNLQLGNVNHHQRLVEELVGFSNTGIAAMLLGNLDGLGFRVGVDGDAVTEHAGALDADEVSLSHG